MNQGLLLFLLDKDNLQIDSLKITTNERTILKTLVTDTLPCWWKLAWSPTEKALRISIAEAYIKTLPKISSNAPIIKIAREKGEEDLFSRFSYDLTAPYFGFNQSIRRLGQPNSEGFVPFVIPLPKVLRNTGMVCQECDGIGKQEYGDSCVWCHGKKGRMVYDWYEAFATTASLQLLFWFLDIGYEEEMPTPSPQTPQILRLNLCADRNMHGSSLGGDLSRDGLQLLRSLILESSRTEKVEERIKNSLIRSWKHMMRNNEWDDFNLRAEIREDANLFITCPGDAAGVYTVNENRFLRDCGCGITCHNMDTPAQALTCLAGLAVFCEELEKKWQEKQGNSPSSI